MKCLIVNGDDFGASPGVNRGIAKTHREGILTSASLLVDAPAGEAAAALSRQMPALSLGLHVDVSADFLDCSPLLRDLLPRLLRRQFERFESLTGRAPTHLDSHHNLHRDPRALPYFLELAQENQIPLREFSSVRHFPKFYGQWGGVTHWEQISAENLSQMLGTEIGPGITELSCHPGFVDRGFSTTYAAEREAEVRALTDPLLRRVLDEQGIWLANFYHVAMLPQPDAPRERMACP